MIVGGGGANLIQMCTLVICFEGIHYVSNIRGCISMRSTSNRLNLKQSDQPLGMHSMAEVNRKSGGEDMLLSVRNADIHNIYTYIY